MASFTENLIHELFSPSNKLRQHSLSSKLVQVLRVCYSDEEDVEAMTDLDDITSSTEVLQHLQGMLEGILESLGLNEHEGPKILTPFKSPVHKIIVYYKRSLHQLLEHNIALIAAVIKQSTK